MIEPARYRCDRCQDSGIEVFQDDNGRWTQGRPCECQVSREKDSLQALFGQNEFVHASHQKTFMGFVLNGAHPAVKSAKAMCESYADNFMSLVSGPHNGLALLGQSGAGKTHLMCAVANELRKMDISMLYVPHVEAMSKFREMIRSDSDSLEHTMARIRRHPVILWDDLWKGREKPTDFELRTTYDIMNYRYMNRLPTIISSERTIDDMLEIDEAIGSRVYEMTKKHCQELPKDANLNYRMRI